MSSAERRSEGVEAANDLRGSIERAEALVSDVIVSTAPSAGERHERAPAPPHAVRVAVDISQQGRRATVILAPYELFEALGAIHAAARARAPIVVHVVGSAAGSSAGRDELAPALEVGAGVLSAWSAQDAVDLSFAARRAAEDSETPWIVVSNGGASEPVSLPDRALLAKFLGGVRPAAQVRAPDPVAEKRAERTFTSRAPFALGSALRELGELTGRPLPAVERYEVADAEEVIVAFGEAFVSARAVAAAMRHEKKKVGAVGIRSLRPFFASEAVKAMARARAIAVIEPLDVALAPSGPLAESLKAAFADALTWAAGFPGVGRIPPVVSAVLATLDGGVSEQQVRTVLDELAAGDRARRVMVFGSDFPG